MYEQKEQQTIPQNEQIDGLILDVYDLAQRIKSVDKLLSKMGEEHKKRYTEDLLTMIGAYKQMAEFLKLELQNYVKTEKKIVNFRYRKILKELEKN